MPDNEKSPQLNSSATNADSQCQRYNDYISGTAQINAIIHKITNTRTSNRSEKQ